MLWSLRHSPSGISPTLWTDFGGTLYVPTCLTALRSRTSPLPLVSDCVLVNAQTTRLVDVSVELTSSPASELRKYSVPPALIAYWPAGLLAGHTVNPARPLARASRVSNCTTVLFAAFLASARLETA